MDGNIIGLAAIVLPALIGFFVLQNVFAIKKKQLETEALQARAASSDLENRVRVLEQIVTENNPMLAQEIDALRALPDRDPVKEEQ